MKQSYLLNHYDVEEIDLGYQFTTSTGIIYYLTFFSYPVVSDFLETTIYYSYNHYNQKKLEEEFRKLVALNFYC